MTPIIGISFETPSTKDSNKIERIIKDTPLKMYSAGNDYLKLIKDRNNTLLGIFNKFTRDVIFTTDKIEPELKEKIQNLISNTK